MNNSSFESSENTSGVSVSLAVPEIAYQHDNMSVGLFIRIQECISYAMFAVALLGFTGNALILVTYVEIGFSESINISFFALAISDILCVACLTWNAICFVPAFTDSGLPFVATEVVIPTGSSTAELFCATTAWITTFISLQRCFCITFPLKRKMMFTPKRTALIIAAICLVTAVPLMSVRFKIYVFYYSFNVENKQTLLRVKYSNTAEAEALYSFLYFYNAICMVLIPMVITLLCSVFLTAKLRRSASWRHKAAGNTRKQSDATITESGAKGELDNNARRKFEKDMRVVRMLLVITTAFIILALMAAARFLIALAMPDFRPLGAYGRTYRVIARLAFLCSLINSSVNVIIYYTMGSKFRCTVNNMFRLSLARAKSMLDLSSPSSR